MLFNSIEFLLFICAVFGAYWALQKSFRTQNILLLVSSYVFYGWWDWRFLFLILGCSLVNFVGGLVIFSSSNNWTRRVVLSFCCIGCLGVLGVYKYFDFFSESLSAVFAALDFSVDFVTLNLVLPVGISFFTFQALSYTIDVYFGKLRPTRDIVEFCTFIAFFPQLVAGPIERATNLLPQFQRERRFDYDAAMHGLCLIAYGLFKKMVVADTLAIYVDSAFDKPGFYGGFVCLIAAIFFAVQIYCDFSGYSDVARGTAKLLGFELMLNFDRPYLSHSFSEFWRKWHISLSSWFKDYVYIPLGGNRVPFHLVIRNLWVVFLLSGLWHGASWSFVLWGGMHAALLTYEVVGKKYFHIEKSRGWLSIVLVDVFIVFAWIFFRAGSVEDAVAFLSAMFTGVFLVSAGAIFAGIGATIFAFSIFAFCLLVLSYCMPRDCAFKHDFARIMFIAGCAMAIVFLGDPAGGEFIYFKF